MNQEITNLLKRYEEALNSSNAQAALALYGSDPIVMPQGAPAFIGREEVQKIYNHFFEVLKLNVIFTIHEIVDMGVDLAYGRTTSAGTKELLASHKVSAEANNELFIFRKEQDHWKIHRYLFSTANATESQE
jgi:ketosteroid isomerase-like protein